ncbi:hypothetical protein RFI_22450 [Reticulomyxa filosa]|uniref:Uncharacterized protein n=1 Tax=Reticulomyxa filosa TaxID=46433 RepID=X6MND5_RETFI|nr:hypothetical protein RFI_22450 [Reticulomyxa filosa]|eukprot:ETO14917.1 hypothetical protein RFI_22450 [Reticulomyxa filosa]
MRLSKEKIEILVQYWFQDSNCKGILPQELVGVINEYMSAWTFKYGVHTFEMKLSKREVECAFGVTQLAHLKDLPTRLGCLIWGGEIPPTYYYYHHSESLLHRFEAIVAAKTTSLPTQLLTDASNAGGILKIELDCNEWKLHFFWNNDKMAFNGIDIEHNKPYFVFMKIVSHFRVYHKEICREKQVLQMMPVFFFAFQNCNRKV